jgi:hypothetical protein
VELYLQSPNTLSWRGAQLGGAQGQLYYFAILKNMEIFNYLERTATMKNYMKDEMEI